MCKHSSCADCRETWVKTQLEESHALASSKHVSCSCHPARSTTFCGSSYSSYAGHRLSKCHLVCGNICSQQHEHGHLASFSANGQLEFLQQLRNTITRYLFQSLVAKQQWHIPTHIHVFHIFPCNGSQKLFSRDVVKHIPVKCFGILCGNKHHHGLFEGVTYTKLQPQGVRICGWHCSP